MQHQGVVEEGLYSTVRAKVPRLEAKRPTSDSGRLLRPRIERLIQPSCPRARVCFANLWAAPTCPAFFLHSTLSLLAPIVQNCCRILFRQPQARSLAHSLTHSLTGTEQQEEMSEEDGIIPGYLRYPVPRQGFWTAATERDGRGRRRGRRDGG